MKYVLLSFVVGVSVAQTLYGNYKTPFYTGLSNFNVNRYPRYYWSRHDYRKWVAALGQLYSGWNTYHNLRKSWLTNIYLHKVYRKPHYYKWQDLINQNVISLHKTPDVMPDVLNQRKRYPVKKGIKIHYFNNIINPKWNRSVDKDTVRKHFTNTVQKKFKTSLKDVLNSTDHGYSKEDEHLDHQTRHNRLINSYNVSPSYMPVLDRRKWHSDGITWLGRLKNRFTD